MKTSTLKNTFQVLMVSALIITSILITKNIIKNIKHLYGMESAGSGMTCFFDMIQ